MTEEEWASHVESVVDSLPPLTDEQINRVVLIVGTITPRKREAGVEEAE